MSKEPYKERALKAERRIYELQVESDLARGTFEKLAAVLSPKKNGFRDNDAAEKAHRIVFDEGLCIDYRVKLALNAKAPAAPKQKKPRAEKNKASLFADEEPPA